jgi:CO/xanthine dehydrogenase Mo-binding subunit/aerobic-type carbon monoxide dehydrogenase small subunit (CoxS/CutS family)
MSGQRPIRLTVNGSPVATHVSRSTTLLELLRDRLGLTGVKDGCSQGDCGCCTVLLNGEATKACLVNAGRAHGAEVLTIEGLSPDGRPHPLQQAFVEAGAVQCGYCTPGQVLAAHALLRRNPNPTRQQVLQGLASVLCRCTGYIKVADAVLLAAARLRGGGARPNGGGGGRALRVVGHPHVLRGALERAMGTARYAADRRRDGMVFAQVLRSPHQHARIVGIHTAPARALPGVLDVITAADIPLNRLCLFDKSFIDPDSSIDLPVVPDLFGAKNIGGIRIPGTFTKDQPAIAEGKVRYRGEPVAVVAARSEAEAREALRHIRVDYEPLPAVGDGLAALAAGAPAVHDRGNLLFTRRIVQGDVAAGFAEADVIVEGTYTTPMVEHAYLEPDAALAYHDDEGRIVVEACCMHPHYIHDEVSHVLQVPTDRVRVIQTPTGGSFGGKHDVSGQVFAALLAHRLGRPVQLVFSRRDVMDGTSKRHAFRMWYRTGARRDGTLTAAHVKLLIEAGAYATWSPGVLTRSAVQAAGPYRCPHVLIEGAAVYTNQPHAGAFRGFGAPQVTFACETQMDKLAERLGMDPWELRWQNAYRGGDLTPTGQALGPTVEMQETLRAVQPAYRRLRAEADRANRENGSGEWRHGAGLASMWFGLGKTGRSNLAEAFVELGKDARVKVYSGAAEVGQGTATVLAQIAAEELGVPYEDVDITVGDTLLTPNADFTCASRQTHISGNAVRFAARDLREVLRRGAARLLDVPAESLEQRDGRLVSGATGEGLTLAEAGEFCRREGMPLRHTGAYDIVTAAINIHTGQGQAYPFFSYGTQAALVKVHAVTGEVRVLKVAAAHDFGTVVNPLSVAGQIEGSICMGLGFTLSEEFVSGKTKRLRDCQVPAAPDMPEVETVMVEVPEPTGPFGAKGAGESTMVPVAPAILNAVADATGARVADLPARPDRVRAAMNRQDMNRQGAKFAKGARGNA